MPVGSRWEWPGWWPVGRLEVVSEPFLERRTWWVLVHSRDGYGLAPAYSLGAQGRRVDRQKKR